MNDDNAGICLGSLTVNIILIVLFVVASYAYHHEKDIIEHGCAQYNSQTGEFEWKEKK